jgi:hypothetical protein
MGIWWWLAVRAWAAFWSGAAEGKIRLEIYCLYGCLS